MSSKNIIDLRDRKTRFREERLIGYSRGPQKMQPLRARRRRARIVAFSLLLLAFGALAYEVHALSYSPRFHIQDISVTGAVNEPTEDVANLARGMLQARDTGFISGATIFTYPKDDIAAALVRTFPRIKSARLVRAEPLATALTIEVQERSPYARWCAGASADTAGSDCYFMDDSGYLFTEAASSSTPLPEPYVFEGGVASSSMPIGQSFVPAHLPGIVALADLLGQSHFSVERIVIGSDTDFTVYLAEGYSLKLSYGANPASLVRTLSLVLSADALQGHQGDLEYVDLRFGDRIYYKLKGENAAQSAN